MRERNVINITKVGGDSYTMNGTGEMNITTNRSGAAARGSRAPSVSSDHFVYTGNGWMNIVRNHDDSTPAPAPVAASEDADLNELSEATKKYLEELHHELGTWSSRFDGLNLTAEEKQRYLKPMLDSSTGKIADKPVLLFGNVFDITTLLVLAPDSKGYRTVPGTAATFSLRNLQPGISREEIAKLYVKLQMLKIQQAMGKNVVQAAQKPAPTASTSIIGSPTATEALAKALAKPAPGAVSPVAPLPSAALAPLSPPNPASDVGVAKAKDETPPKGTVVRAPISTLADSNISLSPATLDEESGISESVTGDPHAAAVVREDVSVAPAAGAAVSVEAKVATSSAPKVEVPAAAGKQAAPSVQAPQAALFRPAQAAVAAPSTETQELLQSVFDWN